MMDSDAGNVFRWLRLPGKPGTNNMAPTKRSPARGHKKAGSAKSKRTKKVKARSR